MDVYKSINKEKKIEILDSFEKYIKDRTNFI